MTYQFSNIPSELSAETLENVSSAQPVSDRYLKSRGAYRMGLKRILDILLVLLVAPLVLPLVMLLSGVIALNGGQPFYSQLRIGAGGERYRIWKLRTMVHDADRALEAYLAQNPDARAEWQSTQKLKNDPRVTAFGRLLRKSSLDELPQLWNVLNGSMSLVGPRPMMVEQEADYPGRSYYNLRPGITGLWQISDRNECSFRDRAKFDDEYESVLSFRTDMRILFATVGVVVRATGH